MLRQASTGGRPVRSICTDRTDFEMLKAYRTRSIVNFSFCLNRMHMSMKNKKKPFLQLNMDESSIGAVYKIKKDIKKGHPKKIM